MKDPVDQGPLELRCLERLLNLSEFQGGLPLTEKAKLCLVEAFRCSDEANVYTYDDMLLRGHIAAASALVPALQTLGANPCELDKQLAEDPLGHDVVLTQPHLLYEYEIGLVERPMQSQPYRVLRLAQAIASASGSAAVDSATVARALFQQAFDYDLYTDAQDLARLARTTLTEQIDEILQERGDDPVAPRESLADLLEYLRLEANQTNVVLRAIGDHLPNVASLRALEYHLAFARTVEPYIESTCDVVMLTESGFQVRRCDYLAPLATRSGETPAPAPLKVSILRGPGVITDAHLKEFEELINVETIREEQLHRFFEAHPGFLLGSDYTRLHSKLTLIPGAKESPVPDFFAESIDSGLADILELKLPTAEIVVGRDGRRGFSAALTQALNQVREYRNFFDDASHRQRFADAYGLDVFRPRVCVVIGRSHSFLAPQERIAIADEYKNLRLLTYDDVLQRARWFASR